MLSGGLEFMVRCWDFCMFSKRVSPFLSSSKNLLSPTWAPCLGCADYDMMYKLCLFKLHSLAFLHFEKS